MEIGNYKEREKNINIYIQLLYSNLPFKKLTGFCQSHTVNLCTDTRVLFFEETCFFWDNSLQHIVFYFLVCSLSSTKIFSKVYRNIQKGRLLVSSNVASFSKVSMEQFKWDEIVLIYSNLSMETLLKTSRRLLL